MHGKTSMIYHQGDTIFAEIPDPFEATRYHSLIVEEASLPDSLQITARTSSGEIMGLRHKQYPVIGVQFHPESILTGYGMKMLENFMHYQPMQENRTIDSIGGTANDGYPERNRRAEPLRAFAYR